MAVGPVFWLANKDVLGWHRNIFFASLHQFKLMYPVLVHWPWNYSWEIFEFCLFVFPYRMMDGEPIQFSSPAVCCHRQAITCILCLAEPFPFCDR